MELLTAAGMRAVEQAAIASGRVTGLALMERAGQGVVQAMLGWRPELIAPHRAVVLCGPGNNGGDGFVVARLLRQRGWEVELFLLGEEARLPPDAAAMCLRWREMGEIRPSVRFDDGGTDQSGESCLIVDALFGTGLTRPLSGEAARLANAIGRRSAGSVIAIDLPSGLCADSGRLLVAGPDPGPRAGLTVTFHAAKAGHFLAEGPDRCGALRIADIGLARGGATGAPGTIAGGPAGGAGSPVAAAALVTRQTLVPRSQDAAEAPLSKSIGANKYSHGHALVLAGGPGRGGAARLAARGALRIGAGLVTVGCPPAALLENAARLDAIMLRPVADAGGLAALLSDERISAICLGPGLGRDPSVSGGKSMAGMDKPRGPENRVPTPSEDPNTDEPTGRPVRDLVAAALAARRATVLDADALSAFAEDPDALFARLHPDCVLTPHMGEFGRLFPDLRARLEAPAVTGPAFSKIEATRAAAARAGCVVLLKGADTVIAAPDGRSAISAAAYERAAPWLATAGSGDVLAGFIAGLLARGFDPMAAAGTAAFLHVECARSFGPGLIAEDLPEHLPGVLHALGL
jgi:hydroxyethylthiazole kinase-like uncharacterized protein yjeF